MRNTPWPGSHRIDPAMKKDDVIAAIRGMHWDPEEWEALRVAANLEGERSETPESYSAFLKRSKAGFWSPQDVLFWHLLIVTHNFYRDHQVGPGSF